MMSASTPGAYFEPIQGTETAGIHEYHDRETSILAAMLFKRAPGYLSLGFPCKRWGPTHPLATRGRI